MDKLNRKSKVPYYQQLYEIVNGKIQRGEYKPGDLLPTDAEFMRVHGVSRNTVRDMLEMLVNQGKIYRERGRGTFVAEPRIEQGMVRIINFTQEMRQRGLTPSSRLLSAELIPAPPDIAASLRVPPGEELALIKRLRLANAQPLSIEEAYFVHRVCPGILTRHDYTVNSLRETLVQDYGILWARAHQTLRAMIASPDIAAHLEIRKRPAVLFVERISYTTEDIPLEFLRIYYRGDRYTLETELYA